MRIRNIDANKMSFTWNTTVNFLKLAMAKAGADRKCNKSTLTG